MLPYCRLFWVQQKLTFKHTYHQGRKLDWNETSARLLFLLSDLPPLLPSPSSPTHISCLSFLSLPLSLSHPLDTLIYSVHCCFNRPLCPGVGIITELPSRLIGLEPAITSVLLEYTDTQTQPCTHKHTLPPFDSVISISEKESHTGFWLQWHSGSSVDL